MEEGLDDLFGCFIDRADNGNSMEKPVSDAEKAPNDIPAGQHPEEDDQEKEHD